MQSAPTNETRAAVWKRCRVIGVINIVIVILALVFCIVELVELIAHPKEFSDNVQKHGHKLPNMYITYFAMGMWIIIYCQLIYYNYGLLRGSTPNDGIVIKKWLQMHICLVIVCIAISIIQVILDTKHIMEIAFNVGTIIVLLIEIIVVFKFYKQLTTSGIENQPTNV
ncbi:uncharacterized protein LOC114132141 isoform X2 [Aphis gossypii]|uniref:Uncharacterized protein n=1 Tax=Aphis gossypii TaxID=80765 RepID=A0A9P0J819_APHGO|nr:uncharacterized protein LOC114132141 isoform X2 [Aphis gossypii]CAH1732679.1 unnamed protein product [Aphis gossypii]